MANPVESFTPKDSGFLIPHGSIFLNKVVGSAVCYWFFMECFIVIALGL